MTIVAAIIVIGIAGIFVARIASKINAATAQVDKMSTSFVANPANDTILVIRGWNREELSRILTDFSKMYRDQGLLSLSVAQRADNIFAISFPQDIPPSRLFVLVNYIQYPKDFDLKRHSIGVVAYALLTPAFGIPDTSFVGKRAAIYVPADDKSYDLVYAKIQSSGAAYKISFTDFVWRPVTDARTPMTITGL